ncbi:MAG: hypothetical protein J7647_01370 [Cyanobacteria bacterium SBLK]|nr:hypothetical protein [Cyanobacteria bacterium SBLK]
MNTPKRDRKKAIALARQGETWRLMVAQHQLINKRELLELLGDAEDIFEKATEADNTYAWAWAHLAATQTYIGGTKNKNNVRHYEDADKNYNTAITLRGNYSWALAHRGQNQVWWELRKLQKTTTPDLVMAAKKIKEVAIDQYFERAIGLDPNYKWALVRMAIAYRIAGLLKSEDSTLPESYHNEALKLLNRVIDFRVQRKKITPNYAIAYAYLAVVHRQQARQYKTKGLFEEATESWEQVYNNLDEAIILNPEVFYPPKLLRIGFVYDRPILQDAGDAPELIADTPTDASEPNIYECYEMAVAKARREGHVAAQRDIDRVLAHFVHQS